MGLSNAIAGGIVMVALISILLTLPGIMSTTTEVQDAATEMSDIETEIYNTDISISSLSASTGSDTITFSLNNDGPEKLWNFDKFNVFVTYIGASSGQKTETITYSSSCSASAGLWCISSLNNDNLDPGIINEGESANLSLTVDENLATGIVIVVVSTQNGVVASTSDSV